MMNNKNLLSWSIGAALVIAAAILLVASGGDGSQSNLSPYSASSLTALENAFDFSTISMQNGNVSHSFKLKNEGEESVTIEKVYTSCMCTIAYVINASGKRYGEFGMPGHSADSKTRIEVMPGESVSVDAVFDPAAHGPSGVGLAERSIYLETNSAKSPKVELKFTALVTR